MSRSLLKIGIVWFMAAVPMVFGQSDFSTYPSMELSIDVRFDPIPENLPSDTARQKIGLSKIKLFKGPVGDTLATALQDQLSRVFRAKFEELAVDVRIRHDRPDSSRKGTPGIRRLFLDVKVFVDSEASLNLKLTLKDSDGGTTLLTYENIIQKGILERDDWWSDLNRLTAKDGSVWGERVRQILHGIAVTLATRAADKTFAWIVETAVRIRVTVETFESIGQGETTAFLGTALKTMFESELSRSRDVIVYRSDTTRKTDMVNYSIEGKFLQNGEELLIDVRCIKKESGRILVSYEFKLDRMDIKQLKTKITDIGSRLKRAMTADFRRESTTLAIVASRPIKSFLADEISGIDLQIAREINRELTDRMRSLPDSIRESKNHMDLRVLYDPKQIEEFLHVTADPSEILADLDVDYLVLLNYENRGLYFRLSVNLHSFSLERPTFADLVYDTCAKKSEADKVIKSAFIKLVNKFCRLGFFKESVLDSDSEMLMNRASIQKSELKDIRTIKGVGLRVGATAHEQVGLFGGKNSSIYYEAFFSYIFPDLRLWIIDFGIEPTFGVDFVKTHSLLKGILAANGFINLKAAFSELPIINKQIVVSAGWGFGGQGIRYIYSSGDPGYEGKTSFTNSYILFATNFFGEVEFPINDRVHFHGFLRRIRRSKEITEFREAKLLDRPEPVGKLGGWYYILGIKYLWR